MGTPANPAAPPAPRSPYPRPWWLAIPRFILVPFVLGGPFYAVLLIWALVRHTLLTTDRTLIDPRTLAGLLPLTVAGSWAFFDLLREDKILRARRIAERRQSPVQYLDRRFFGPLVANWQRQLARARAKGDRQAELVALTMIGLWLEEGEHYEEATPYFQEALVLARAMGDQPFREERALYGLGAAAFERGDRDTAEDMLRQCLAITTTLGHEFRWELADTYAHVGEFLCEYRDQREEGRQLLAQAQALYHEISQTRPHPRWLEEEQHMRDLRRKYGDDGR